MSIKLPKILTLIILYALIFANIGLSYSKNSLTSYQAVITKVVDGDTVWVKKNSKKIKLRLLGIDTPEKYESKKLHKDSQMCGVKPKQMTWIGELASKHAKELLKPGQEVTIKVYGRGYYGRALAMIILPDGTNFNEAMVKDGYACVYKYRGHKSKELPWDEWVRLNDLLDKAKSERKGLWQDYYSIIECLCD